MTPLVFVRIGDDLLVRLDLIVGCEEERYSRGQQTRIYLLGKKEPAIYNGPLSEVERKIIDAVTAIR